MELKYSNRKLWLILAVELSIAGLVFLYLTALIWPYSRWSLLVLALAFFAFGSAIYVLQNTRRNFIIIKDHVLSYRPLGHFNRICISFSQVKRIVKHAHILSLQTDDDKKHKLNLNYLSPDDITRLLMYFKYMPLIKYKFL